MIERIKKIIEDNELTPSRFADEINIQRSAISHMLSGRNKPSLDVVQKILIRFPQVPAQWLLTGNIHEGQEASDKKENTISAANQQVVEQQVDVRRKIDKIVVFFTDHTFEEYQKGS